MDASDHETGALSVLLEDIGYQEDSMAVSRRYIEQYSLDAVGESESLVFYTQWLAEATELFRSSSAALALLLA